MIGTTGGKFVSASSAGIIGSSTTVGSVVSCTTITGGTVVSALFSVRGEPLVKHYLL